MPSVPCLPMHPRPAAWRLVLGMLMAWLLLWGFMDDLPCEDAQRPAAQAASAALGEAEEFRRFAGAAAMTASVLKAPALTCPVRWSAPVALVADLDTDPSEPMLPPSAVPHWPRARDALGLPAPCAWAVAQPRPLLRPPNLG